MRKCRVEVTSGGLAHARPIRNDPGRFRSPHATILGRLVPNGLPMGKKADTRPWVDWPYQQSTARRNPRSERGARGREERGPPSLAEPDPSA